MTTITTTELLAGLGTYLASVALAQYNDDQAGYLDHPDLPAVLFASADTPDHCLVASVAGYDPDSRYWDLALAFRAVGWNAVEDTADAVFDHFDTVMGKAACTWEYGTIIARPTLAWGALTLTSIDRITRGAAELTSESKNKGQRFVRSDVYRVSVTE